METVFKIYHNPFISTHLVIGVWDSKDRVNQSQRIFGNVLWRDLLIIIQFSNTTFSLNFKSFEFLKREPVRVFLFWKNIRLTDFDVEYTVLSQMINLVLKPMKHKIDVILKATTATKHGVLQCTHINAFLVKTFALTSI